MTNNAINMSINKLIQSHFKKSIQKMFLVILTNSYTSNSEKRHACVQEIPIEFWIKLSSKAIMLFFFEKKV